MNPTQPRTNCLSARRAAGALALALGAAAPAALAFTFEYGELKGSLDSTLSVGGSYRLGDPSPALYATSASFDGVAGRANSVNGDDGNLNYSSGLFSLVAKGTHDLELKYRNFAGFFRGTYFHDFENDSNGLRYDFTGTARKKVVGDMSLLDAYLSGKFDIDGMPVTVRFGRQVLSWGESTFMPNGINIINPVDVARLRTPGAELREALKPVPMVSASFGLTQNLSLDAFYLLAFKKTDLDPRGSYFSTNDFAGFGGQRVYLGFGSVADNRPYGFVTRGQDIVPEGRDQFGLALRYLAPQLNDTEFGLYFLKIDSRLPLISARTPTRAISAAEVQATASSLAQTNLAPAMIGAGFPSANVPGALTTLLGAALTGVPGSALPTNLQPFYPAATAIAANARTLGFFSAAATGNYIIEYPRDIQVSGVSFNTGLGNTGISLQGEISLKHDQPLQVDDVELLFATLSSINPAFGANNQLGNYLGRYNTYVPGYKRYDVWQAQATATKVFGRALGADQWVLIGEVGAINVAGLPAKGTLRFDGSGTYTSGSAAAMTGTGNGQFPATPLKGFADKFSWGYQLLARFDYSNVFAGWNVSPSLGWAHDVAGNTPLPLGNFVRGRNTLTLGVEFSYQNRWAVDLRYARYAGAGPYNLLADRDFISSTLKYSF